MTVKRGKNRKNALVFETMCLKKPTALDKIIDTVPKPEGAVPNFGLPKWKHLPLESKIPMVKGPKNAYNLSRRKLGEKLWVQTKDAEFNLSDPYNYEMELNYDSMHDEHLARYFSRERNTRCLLKLGLISEDFDAICTLKDYNMYRKFLKKLHNDAINKELKRRVSLNDEKRVLGFADSAAKREIDRLKKEERKKLAREKAREELESEKKKETEERRVAAEKLRKRLEAIELAKEKDKRERISKLRKETERARRKRAEISEIQQDLIIRTMFEWRRKESIRRKIRGKRLAKEAEEKRRVIEEKWERRKEEEEIEMARRESVLNHAEEEREKSIKNYTNKINKERAKLEKRRKNYSRFLSCYMTRTVSGRGKNACCFESKRQKGKRFVAKINFSATTMRKVTKDLIIANIQFPPSSLISFAKNKCKILRKINEFRKK